MRAGGEKRGNSRDRRIRKLWMLSQWGDGIQCPCVHCGDTLTYTTVEADRKVPGGSYARHNVQPACRRCNSQRQNDVTWTGCNPQPSVTPDTSVPVPARALVNSKS